MAPWKFGLNIEMTQNSLDFDRVTFSAKVSQEAKSEGMELAAKARRELLELVQLALVRIANQRESRECSADDGQRWLVEHGYSPSDLGCAAGSMFPAKLWEFTGKRMPSQRVSRRSNEIKVWRLR